MDGLEQFSMRKSHVINVIRDHHKKNIEGRSQPKRVDKDVPSKQKEGTISLIRMVQQLERTSGCQDVLKPVERYKNSLEEDLE